MRSERGKLWPQLFFLKTSHPGSKKEAAASAAFGCAVFQGGTEEGGTIFFFKDEGVFIEFDRICIGLLNVVDGWIQKQS